MVYLFIENASAERYKLTRSLVAKEKIIHVSNEINSVGEINQESSHFPMQSGGKTKNQGVY